jgi:hypothetical protein
LQTFSSLRQTSDDIKINELTFKRVVISISNKYSYLHNFDDIRLDEPAFLRKIYAIFYKIHRVAYTTTDSTKLLLLRRPIIMEKKSLTSIILITALLGFTKANLAQEESSEERVIIGFKDETGRQAAERHRAWIRESGGYVRHSYRFIPGVAARLTTKQISRLKEDPRVAYFETGSKV